MKDKPSKNLGPCIREELMDLAAGVRGDLIDLIDVYGRLKAIMKNKCCQNCQTRKTAKGLSIRHHSNSPRRE